MEEKIEHHHDSHFEYLDEFSIAEKDAADRTKEWRKFIKENVPDIDDAMLPRAVFISMEDIMALYNRHKEAIGVRAYFTKKDQPYFEDPGDVGLKPEIAVVLVPVGRTGDPFDDKDWITPDLRLPAGKSFVYDFTKPCPDLCDISSPLYYYE